jgi:hypothetical protein
VFVKERPKTYKELFGVAAILAKRISNAFASCCGERGWRGIGFQSLSGPQPDYLSQEFDLLKVSGTPSANQQV